MISTIKHTKDMMTFLMRPLREKPQIYHLKITKAITQPTVSSLLLSLKNLKSEKPKVLAISINSAVGSFAQAQRAHDALQQTTQELHIPLYTFAEDISLGVGYYLLSAGSTVHANPFSLIGDFSQHERAFGISKLLENFNVKTEKFGNSVLIDAFERVTDENRLFIQNHLELELQELIAQVKINRNKSFSRFTQDDLNQRILLPNVYNAQQAVENGLVDEISTFEAFISQNYPDTNVKEISMEQDIATVSIIQAKLELRLAFEIQTILNKVEQNLSDNDYLVEVDRLYNLFKTLIKDDQQSLQVLSNVMANFINQQMINRYCD